MQTTAEGIPTALVEFPIRYMHTPVEIGVSQGYLSSRPAIGRVYCFA